MSLVLDSPKDWSYKSFVGFKKSGVYVIWNLLNNKVYVGSCKLLSDRWRRHYNTLNRQVHENSKLQNAWNKYGAQSFKVFVLEYCDHSLLIEQELKWINLFDACNYGYNIIPIPGTPPIQTEESKHNFSLRVKKMFENDEYMKRHKERSSKMMKHLIETGVINPAETIRKLNAAGITNSPEQKARAAIRIKKLMEDGIVGTTEQRQYLSELIRRISHKIWTPKLRKEASVRVTRWHENRRAELPVDLIIEMKKSGMSYPKIAIMLNELGYETHTKRAKWNGNTVGVLARRFMTKIKE
ncbi:hypothetical protein C4577_06455 [Candidatus Parcubacteria bacterium]|nr:MAG: hypothetical protein C4577_06455 [Candidatus Parcubacteria bacterium]